jgi:hypothetical protein
MGLKEIISKWKDSKKEKSEQFKHMQEQRHFEKVIEQREKSSEERQLERFMEEERQKKIKMALDDFNKKRTKDLWKGEYSVLNNQKNILKEDRQILKQKNIFNDNKTKIPFVQRGMYFN